MPSRSSGGRNLLPVALTALGIAVIASAFVVELVKLLAACSKGIDLSDEAFYIQSAAYLHVKPLEGPWGGVLHYLYRLVGGDIAAYRAVSLCILVASGCMLGGVAGRTLSLKADRLTRDPYAVSTLIAYVLLGGDLTLIFYGSRILTPGYNWVNLVGLNLAVTGLILVRYRRPDARHRVLPASLLVIGVLLVFSARIATVIVLLVVIGAFLADLAIPGAAAMRTAMVQPTVSRSIRSYARHHWSAIVACLVLLASYLVFVASPAELVAGIRRQVKYGHVSHQLQMGSMLHTDAQAAIHTLWSAMQASRYGLIAIAAVTALSWIAILSRSAGRHRRDAQGVGALFDVSVVAALVAFLSHDLAAGTFAGGQSTWTTMTVTSLATMMIAVAGLLGRLVLVREGAAILLFAERRPDAVWNVALLSIGLPTLAIAFGLTSANGIAAEASLSSPLIFLAAIILLTMQFAHPAAQSIGLLAVGCVAVLAVAGVVNGGINSPYRITAMHPGAVHSATIGEAKSTIALGEPDYSFISGLQSAALKAGFTPGQPVEDFSPFNPGVGFIIGAHPAPTVFLAVLTQDSSLFRWSISLQSRQFRNSGWLITSSNGPTLGSAAEMVGCHPPSAYHEVFRGYWAPEQEWLYLFKPDALAPSSCKTRGANGG